MSNIEENLKNMSEYQQNQAKKDRKVYQVLAMLSVHELESAIRINLIRNNEINSEDVNSEDKAFGSDLGGLKSKTARSRPKPVQNNSIDIRYTEITT